MQIVKPIIFYLFLLISKVYSVVMSLGRFISKILRMQVDIICIETLQLLVANQVATMLYQPASHTLIQSRVLLIVKLIEHMAQVGSLE